MPFVAVFHVPDDHTADALLSGELGTKNMGMHFVGLFNYPDKADLTCPGTCMGRGARAHSVRDEDGAMICSNCGGQSPIIRELLMRAFRDYLGRNLFRKAPKAFRTDND